MLEIHRRLAEKNPEAFDSDVVMALNNLTFLHANTRRNKLVFIELKEALTICRRMAEYTYVDE